MLQKLRIATRQSALALWQANHVRNALIEAQPSLEIQIIGFTTEGDRNQRSPLREIGGKGLFIKELEQALLSGAADIAVHSMKDVPSELPSGLQIGAICERADPRDALVSKTNKGLSSLVDGSRIGTSSMRRRLQLQASFSSFEYVDLRGNVDTRLSKLDAKSCQSATANRFYFPQNSWRVGFGRTANTTPTFNWERVVTAKI